MTAGGDTKHRSTRRRSTQHLRELISRCRPHESYRQICHEAGVSQRKLTYWLDEKRPHKRMPDLDKLAELADLIGTDPTEVHRAFSRDMGLSSDDTVLTRSEEELLGCYRSLSPREQNLALSLVRAILDQSG